MAVNITYFVHGTTTDNENNISTGWNQGELSELVIEQSKELGEIIKDKRLRECNYGNLNGASENLVNYDDHIEIPFLNGESMKDVEVRIKDFLDFLKQNYNGKNISILAHKAPQLALEVLLNKKTWEKAIETDWRNTKTWQPGWKYQLN